MISDYIRDRAFAYAMRHDMLKEHERVVAGISGGADSMCLLGLLLEWREILDLHITVLHVNHGIRGAAADEDERFVESFCREHGVDFRAIHADVPELARNSGTTEEEAGRNLRYKVFLETAEELGCTRIAVAHNRSDNAETVIFNILRGSGIDGVKGISPVRVLKVEKEITIIRPLLDTSREEIEMWLADHNMTFRTDATNFDTEYSRNAIRNIVMPLFKERINSASEEHIVRLAAQAAQIGEYLSARSEEAILEMTADGKLCISGSGSLSLQKADMPSDDTGSIQIGNKQCYVYSENLAYNTGRTGISTIRLNIPALLKTDPLLRGMIVRRLVGKLAGKLKDIANVHIDDVLELMNKQTGRKVDLPYGITAQREYDELVLERMDRSEEDRENLCAEINNIYSFTENSPFTFTIPDGYIPQGAVLKAFVSDRVPGCDFTKNLYTKCFDCDKIIDSVSIRTRKTGDYLLLRGKNGELFRKSLKSWFIDNKVPAKERDGLVLVAEGSHVLWVAGYRRDDSCFVDDGTRRVLVTVLETGI